MQREISIDNSSKNLLNRKLKILIADDEQKMIDEIISNIDSENEDYEIVGYALSTEEERQKIEELKPDIVITDIFRGSLGQKNEGGLTIIKEYSQKYLLPKFIVISYTPNFIENNIIGVYGKLPSVDYDRLKRQLHYIKMIDQSMFIRGYEKINVNKEEINDKKESFMSRLKRALFE